MKSSDYRKARDLATYPLRAVIPFPKDDRWNLTPCESERFDYAAREVIGYCLDVGCGKNNRFVTEYLDGHDMDTERGMEEGEAYYLTDTGIVERTARAGCRAIKKKRFVTQRGLNHLFVGWKS